MKKFIWLSSLCVVVLVSLAGSTLAQCTGERWPVKVGNDTEASLVNLNATTPTTIATLAGKSVPATLPDNARVKPTETTVWVLNATLLKYARSFDADYHMVFSDGAGHTMIGEIPDPGCLGPGSPFAVGIAHARAQFDAMFTATTTFQSANVPVQITGVGFFDYFEGQEGIAPNGIELHPIIDISFGPNFSLSSSPSALTIPQSGAGSVTISTTLSGGFNSSIALSTAGLPPGATAAFNPGSIAAPGSGSSTLTISVDAATPVGTYNAVINASGGGQTHSLTINFTVSPAGTTTQQLLANPGFENGSSAAPWTVSTGVIDNSSFEAPHTGSWKAWLNGYGSTHTDTLLQPVSIPSNVTSAILSFWRHIDTAETTNNKANDTLKIQVRNSSGTVLATLATYSNLNAAAGYTQVSLDLTAYKGQTIQIYLVGVENQSLKTSFVVDDFALNATTSDGAAADFAIAAAPSALTVTAGTSGTSTITTAISGGFNSSVLLSASGLPSGATVSFSPATIAAPGSGSSTMTLSVGAATAAGVYNLIINGSGAGKTHSASFSLTVSGGAIADFGTSAAPSALTVTAGNSGSSTITTTTSGGFNSAVTLSASGLPSGATATFNPTSIAAPGAGTSTLTILVGASTTAGTYSVVVSGAGGSQAHSTTISLTVSAAADFAIAAAPSAVAVTAGSSSAATITTTTSGNFNSPISLSASGLPSGATASFSPASIAAPGAGTSTLTIAVGSATAGTYNVVVNGSGGSKTHAATISLTVSASGGTTQQLLGNPGFENGSASPAPWTVTPAVIDNGSFEPAHSGSWKAWLNGYGSVHTDTLFQQVSIPSTATNATLSFWRHIDTAETTTTAAYDTLKVQVRNSSGTVLATLATYSNLNAGAGYTQVSFDLAAYKGQTIQIYLVGTEDTGGKTSFVLDDFILNVTTP